MADAGAWRGLMCAGCQSCANSLSTRDREASATVRQLAYLDSVTGLPNRSYLLEAMHGEIAAATQQQRSLALLHLEVSSLHEINKVLGYQSGDTLAAGTAAAPRMRGAGR